MDACTILHHFKILFYTITLFKHAYINLSRCSIPSLWSLMLDYPYSWGTHFNALIFSVTHTSVMDVPYHVNVDLNCPCCLLQHVLSHLNRYMVLEHPLLQFYCMQSSPEDVYNVLEYWMTGIGWRIWLAWSFLLWTMNIVSMQYVDCYKCKHDFNVTSYTCSLS